METRKYPLKNEWEIPKEKPHSHPVGKEGRTEECETQMVGWWGCGVVVWWSGPGCWQMLRLMMMMMGEKVEDS